MNFKFKRLMFLGATAYQLPAIKKAKELGCIVITVSDDLSQIGHSFGDLSLKISTIDRELILQAAKAYKIDAIMTYAANAAVETVSYVALELNLPGNPLKAASILQNKGLFRKLQKKINLPYPEFYISSTDKTLDAVSELLTKHKSIIIKPTDAGGSRGQSVIKSFNKVQIKKAFQHAINESTAKEVIFEEKIKGTVLELDGDVFFQNGELKFALYGHNYFKKGSKYNVPVGEIFPADIPDEIKNNLDNQFQLIISELKLTYGCMNFDAIISGDEVYIIDIALRNGGNFVPEMIKFSSGFDMTAASVFSAFGTNFPHTDKNVATPVLSNILSSSEDGVYNGYSIDPNYVKNTIFEHQFIDIGDCVSEFKTGSNTLGVVGFQFDSVNQAMDFTEIIDDVITLDIDTKKKAKGTAGFRVSSFLESKLAQAKTGSDLEKMLQKQFYVSTKTKSSKTHGLTLKHYEASSLFEYEGEKLLGLERLYRRVLLVEPTLQCLANCRHCLRQFYSPFALSDKDLERIANAIIDLPELEDITELLITGGDPLLIPLKLTRFLSKLDARNNKIETVRIASRIPIHNPSYIDDNIIALFSRKYSFRVEMATQINHSLELFPEVKDAFSKIRQHKNIYNQTVILKGLNDQPDILISLFDNLRSLGIENHYIFHCVPIKGIESLRTSVDESIDIVKRVVTSGYISGRAKPQLALMTDVGKITLYEDSIIDRKGDLILLQTYYKYKERKEWNPYWELPDSSTVDKSGNLRVWYKDGV